MNDIQQHVYMLWILMREGGVKVASYFRFTIKKEKKSEAYYICV